MSVLKARIRLNRLGSLSGGAELHYLITASSAWSRLAAQIGGATAVLTPEGGGTAVSESADSLRGLRLISELERLADSEA
jgi:hypothetical protein